MIAKAKELAIRTLRWSERYTKTDMVYLASGGFWLTLGHLSTAISVFALGVAFANLLPKDTYGTYKYVLSFAGLLSVFTLPGMTTALLRAVARGYEGSMVLATKVRITYSFIGVICILSAAIYYHFMGNDSLSLSLFIISIFLPFFDTFSTFYAFLQSKKKFGIYTGLGAIVQIGSSVLILIALLFTDNLFILISIYFASYTILRSGCWWYVRKRYQPQEGIDPEMVPYAKHLSVMGFLSQLAAQADILLTFHFLGAAEVAIYAIATAPAEQLKNFISTVNDLLLPRFAGHSEKAVRKGMYAKCAVTFVSIIIVVGTYILLAPILFHILFAKYAEAIPLTQLYAISLIGFGLMPMTIFLQAHGKVKELYYSNTITSLFQIGAVAVGVIHFGLLGLVIARIATRVVGASLSLFFFIFPLGQVAK